MTRRSLTLRLVLFLVLISLSNLGCKQASTVPPHLYLTWASEDTSTSMAINFHSDLNLAPVTVHYDTESRGASLASYRWQAKGAVRDMASIGRRVHWIELKDLIPGGTYYFVVSDGNKSLTTEKKLRTIPTQGPLHFVTGGDMAYSPELVTLYKYAAKMNPQFALIGGDIAYDNGDITKSGLWDEWLSAWTANMVNPDGTLIPMVVGIGNHEVQGGYLGSLEKAPFYANYFFQDPGKSYFARKFGSDLMIYALDSGHAATHAGPQSQWLEGRLAEAITVPLKFAVYHVPMYPSVRSFDELGSAEGRRVWLPLFERYGVTAAFENHDHALKRTKVLKESQPSAEGIVYFGDGCWGKTPRAVDASRYYLAHAESTQHFWAIDVEPKEIRAAAIGVQGSELDQFVIPRK